MRQNSPRLARLVFLVKGIAVISHGDILESYYSVSPFDKGSEGVGESVGAWCELLLGLESAAREDSM